SRCNYRSSVLPFRSLSRAESRDSFVTHTPAHLKPSPIPNPQTACDQPAQIEILLCQMPPPFPPYSWDYETLLQAPCSLPAAIPELFPLLRLIPAWWDLFCRT